MLEFIILQIILYVFIGAVYIAIMLLLFGKVTNILIWFLVISVLVANFVNARFNKLASTCYLDISIDKINDYIKEAKCKIKPTSIRFHKGNFNDVFNRTFTNYKRKYSLGGELYLLNDTLIYAEDNAGIIFNKECEYKIINISFYSIFYIQKSGNCYIFYLFDKNHISQIKNWIENL